MVIDVMDLNINKLLFNRPYDSRRLRRGRDLYERQNVTIHYKKVSKTSIATTQTSFIDILSSTNTRITSFSYLKDYSRDFR